MDVPISEKKKSIEENLKLQIKDFIMSPAGGGKYFDCKTFQVGVDR